MKVKCSFGTRGVLDFLVKHCQINISPYVDDIEGTKIIGTSASNLCLDSTDPDPDLDAPCSKVSITVVIG